MKHKKLENVSAHISKDLATKLRKVSAFEKRSKSYYITHGLEKILNEKITDLEDYMNAKKTLDEAKAKKEKFVSFDEVFKGVK